MTARRSHCLLALARRNGYPIPAIPHLGHMAVGVVLTLVWLTACVCLTLVQAVLVLRQRREPRRRIVPAAPEPRSMVIVCEPPHVAPIAPLATQATPAVASVVGTQHMEPETPCPEYDTWSATLPTAPARIPLPVVEAPRVVSLPLVPAPVKPARKLRRKPTLALACEAARPAAIQAGVERVSNAGKDYCEGARKKEQADLAALPVARLRQLAVAAGHKGTRTMRKAELVELLSTR